MRRSISCSKSLFQFTPLREGRRWLTLRFSRSARFQFTPLREGRPGRTRWFCHRQHFNSRPSARGDAAMADISAIAKISIHAPPRGATRSNEHGKRADYFNSRPSARGDVAVLGKRADTRRISIHAPPRGATTAQRGLCIWASFQFTPLREGRRRTAGKMNF